MPTVPHNTLTSADLHEPKGASSASLGMVYIANGSGSGTWTLLPQGWGFYKDAGAAQSITTTPTLLSIDSLGSTTDETFLPLAIRGTGSLWDSTTNRITPISDGDSYDTRVDLPITAKANGAATLTIELDIGGLSQPSIVVASQQIVLSKTPPFTVSPPLPIFTRQTFKANGGQIFISTDTGTAEITNPGIFISRNSSGLI